MRYSRQLRMLQPPAQLGHLADSSSAAVPIIRSSSQNDSSIDISSDRFSSEKFHPLSIEARSPNQGMAHVPLGLSKTISKLTLDWSPQQIRQRVAQMYSDLQRGMAHTPAFEKLDVDSQILGMFLQNYTSLTNVLREVKKRRPDFAPVNVLDVGFGPATGLLAAREVFADANVDVRETAVIIGHPRMKRRAKELLGDEKRVLFRDEVPKASSPKRFDLIIATHQLFQHGQFSEELVDSHTQKLAQLLDKNGTLVFVERGDPLGFEAVALAREHMTRSKYGFNVVGPCTHNQRCPLQIGLDIRQRSPHAGRENWCRFSQNVDRPKFTKELKKGQYLSQKWIPDAAQGAGGKKLKGTGRPGGNNNEVAYFSWVALENVKEPKQQPSSEWPRIMKQPMKRHGHVTFEVCAPNGNIEHWTVPRSQGKQDYHDIRKANAADLWALGAKVKQARGGLQAPEKLAESAVRIHRNNGENRQTNVPEWLGEPCKDWWEPSANPFYKFSSHQARIHSENMADPEQDGFIPVMDSLIADEGRFDKLMSREIQKRYQR